MLVPFGRNSLIKPTAVAGAWRRSPRSAIGGRAMVWSKITLPLFLLFAGAALAASCVYAADESVQLQREATHINVVIGGKPFTTYYFDPEVAKPYFMPLRSAQGTIITRGFPIGNTVPPEHQHDRNLEPHQRPMYFGHGNVDGIDFWGEAIYPKWSDGTVFGRTVLDKIEDVQAGADSGTIRALFHLVGPLGRIIADETQAFVFRGDRQTRMIDCEFTITANHGADVTMGDTKEGAFAIRVVKELYSPPGHMVNSEGGVC